jgi:FKBP-type peptidyl-prolyl cis-trans isomerase
MKSIVYVLGLVLLLSGIFTSCKENSLEAMRDDEVETLDQYVKDNNLAAFKDPSGLYFKITEASTDTTMIRPGFKVMLHYNIFLMDSTKIFSTEDESGYTYEEDPFYVDISNDDVDANPIQSIAGMHLALKKMHVGDKAFVVIPSELAYKALDYSSTYGIPRFSTLLVYVYAKKGYSPNQQ